MKPQDVTENNGAKDPNQDDRLAGLSDSVDKFGGSPNGIPLGSQSIDASTQDIPSNVSRQDLSGSNTDSATTAGETTEQVGTPFQPENHTESSIIEDDIHTENSDPDNTANEPNVPGLAPAAGVNTANPEPTSADTISAVIVSGAAASGFAAGLSAPRRPWKMIAVIIAAVLILVGGGVFGYYLPNRPSSVWSTGMSRSGKALAAMVEKAAEPKTVERYQQSKMQLEASLTWGGSTGKLVWNGASDDKNSKGKLVLSSSGGSGDFASADYEGTLEYLLKYTDTKQLPDLYFKASDLKNISLEDYNPQLAAYVNKWIFVGADSLKDFYPYFEAGEVDKNKRINSQDVADAAKILSETIRDYVLTSDGEKAVIVQKSFVGNETVDGVKAYHFKAGINRENAKKYCEVFVQKMSATSLYTKLADSEAQTEENKKAGIKSCQDGVDATFKDEYVYDVWIDGKYKLINKIRIPAEQGSDQSYTEIGQHYKGGDVISLFTRYHAGGDYPYDAEWTLESNAATGMTTSKASGKSPKADENDVSFEVTFTSEPTRETVDGIVPKDAVPIQTILGMSNNPTTATPDLPTTSSPIANRSKDAERQTDIHAIQANVEAFYAQKGFYPTLADLQDSSFVAQHMKGLNASALLDPDQSTGGLQETSGQNPPRYGYVASGSGGGSNMCNNMTKTFIVAGSVTDNACSAFVVSATLSDGTKYTKDSSF